MLPRFLSIVKIKKKVILMDKLTETFKNGKDFIAFVTANDPDMQTTVKNVVALAQGGADIVELGIPFSDPIADGPVIKKADLRALRDVNFPIQNIFKGVDKIRQQTSVPLVFLTYLNIILQYGFGEFCHDCKKSGVNGLIIPDLPYEEQAKLKKQMDKYGIDLIQLIALNSDERIPKIAKRSEGFIYLVSSLGVTGERNRFSKKLKDVVKNIQKNSKVPVAIGFGIHTPQQAAEMARISDGAIIGSACVKIVAKYKQQSPAYLKKFAGSIKKAVAN